MKTTVKPVANFTAADWQLAFEREVARACELARRLRAAEAEIARLRGESRNR